MTRLLLVSLLFCAISPTGTNRAVAQPKPNPSPKLPMLPPALVPPMPAPILELAPAESGREAGPATLAEAQTRAERIFQGSVAQTIQTKCFRCHGDQRAAAGLNLERLKPDFVTADSAEKWRRVYERVRDGEMPPKVAGAPPETPDERGWHTGLAAALSLAMHPVDRLLYDWERPIAPLPIRSEDATVIRLRKQLHNNLARELEVLGEQYSLGRVSLDVVAECVNRLTEAGLAVSTTKAERITLLRRALAANRIMEDSMYSRFQGGNVDEQQLLQSKSNRLESQIQLQLELDKK